MNASFATIRTWTHINKATIYGWLIAAGIVFVLASFGIAIWKFTTCGPTLFTLTGFVGMVVFIVATVFCAGGDQDRARDYCWRLTQAVSLLTLVSVPQFDKNAEEVWVNTETGATTIHQPVWSSLVPWRIARTMVSVPTKYYVHRSTNVSTDDGVPLTCTITVSGIVLDMDRLDIETKARELAAMPLKAPANLSDAFATSAAAVLARESAEDIERHSTLVIPYRIGSRVGDTLQSLGLKWNDGEVGFSCKVRFG